MLDRYWMTLAAGSLGLALTLGCAKPPQQSMDDASSALETARKAEAAEYAPEAWQLAQDALASANAEVAAQGETFALFRSYEEATDLLNRARDLANAAGSEATRAREQAKSDAAAAITEAEAAIAAATAALETAPKGKGTEADLMAMKAELEAMGTALTAANDAFAAGQLREARSRASAVRDQANAIAEDIAMARTKKRAT